MNSNKALDKLSTCSLGSKGKLRREEEFHDNWARSIDVDKLLVRESFEAVTAVENKRALEELAGLKGKKILDLGCGAGEASVYFAIKGADVYAVDISKEMLKKAQELAAKHKVNIKTFNMRSEKLEFEDDYFDFLFGNGVLHHSCLEPAFSEASRVLKKEGKAVFIEPLGYNPLISIYRKMAKSVRTINETPLKYNDIKITKRFFSSVRFEYFWFFSLFIFIYMYIVERIHPSSQRYWKRIISQSEKYRALFRPLNYFDCLLLKVFPFMGRFCWNIVIILEDKIKAPLYG